MACCLSTGGRKLSNKCQERPIGHSWLDVLVNMFSVKALTASGEPSTGTDGGSNGAGGKGYCRSDQRVISPSFFLT